MKKLFENVGGNQFKVSRVNESSDICPECNGSGEGPADGTRCQTCKGSGRESNSGSDKDNDFAADIDIDTDPKKDRSGMDETAPKQRALKGTKHPIIRYDKGNGAAPEVSPLADDLVTGDEFLEGIIGWMKTNPNGKIIIEHSISDPKKVSSKKPTKSTSGGWEHYREPGRDHIPETPYGE